MQIRRSHERGHFENNWLNSYHSFSFSDYFDRKHMNFFDLRVINEDLVQPSAGFPTHGHRDMEIITYVIQGVVTHKDSMGNSEQIRAGEVQVMSAGRGVLHSEFNPDAKKPLKLLQIWVTPNQEGLAPSYQQQVFSEERKLNRLCLIASPDSADGSLLIHQDVRLYASVLKKDVRLTFPVLNTRAVWLQMVRGEVQANDETLKEGDAVSLSMPGDLNILAKQESEFLLFDLIKQ